MELAYIEQDPNSAPHAVQNRSPPEHIERNPNSAPHAAKNRSPSKPPFLYIPEHNDKYPVFPQTQTNSLTGPIIWT
ncbi:uncharacterized protein EURHEDRAFT_412791 [Aspergillus ruber CBS 135680]|uniref:Uncharacterized protein n=1 Tax=Aspergillus ruber (strain CBS 135680) TaxID=1388766 RepID=A0A017SE73_ASPRC|nr:uncharacterized protein EURHEDRAFT_412791 [Aspergillus ruber CBS 135680]EYE94939.1 hypothetical protein EURHEDRAFT_412791 [Aspergillus ruber CBS 135680]